jgi:hypothetical protein
MYGETQVAKAKAAKAKGAYRFGKFGLPLAKSFLPPFLLH